jgi:GntR family transcriptional regulator
MVCTRRSPLISLRLDPQSGVSTYLQLVQQVRQAIQLGALREGDQLPTVKEVVAELAINPNTVLKAYRELEHEGLCTGRPGVGTFVTRTLTSPSPQVQAKLRTDLARWVDRAAGAGLDTETMVGLLRSVVNDAGEARVSDGIVA